MTKEDKNKMLKILIRRGWMFYVWKSGNSITDMYAKRIQTTNKPLSAQEIIDSA